MNKVLHQSGLFLILALTLIACDPETKVKAVADKFLTHIEKGEFEEATQYATKETGQILAMAASFMEEEIREQPPHEDLRCLVEEDGNTAKCSYQVGDETETINLIKVDGEWKVHLTKE
ncbi:MAG: hypothetical protein ACLFQS_11725 [Bacteroidales bacterium]